MDPACSENQLPGLITPAVKYHHPLPLRSSGSETQARTASQGHTNTAQDIVDTMIPPYSGHGILTDHQKHYDSKTPMPPLMDSKTHNGAEMPTAGNLAGIQPETIHKGSGIEDFTRHDFPQNTPGAMRLTAFPIPPMRNPVGELPMLIHRAVSPSPTAPIAQTLASKSPSSNQSVAETYRAITKVHMIKLLERTRSRGAQLPKIDWNTLTTSEKNWREENRTVLTSIYGCRDVMLTQHDVGYVNCVARELCSDGDGVSSNEWVLRIFQGDI
jgi:hypothetical protein